MNTWGKCFRLHIYGESHGDGLGVLIDGCPAGISLSEKDFEEDLLRRKPQGALGTPRREEDQPSIGSGLFEGHTTGAPLLLSFLNKDTRSRDYSSVLSQPRPGHADWIAQKKYGGFADHRGGGHFSGRLTLALVAAGVVAKKLLPLQAQPRARIKEVGGESNIDKALSRALSAQDSIGGVIECRCEALAAGLGEPFFDTIEGLLSHAMFAIPAIKGISFGNGFEAARLFGSQNNDVFVDEQGHTQTNHAGGVTGGMSNGNPLYFQVAVKPTSSTPAQQQSFDIKDQHMKPLEVKGRHDLCIALRVPVVVEAVTACVLADLMLMEQQMPRVFPAS